MAADETRGPGIFLQTFRGGPGRPWPSILEGGAVPGGRSTELFISASCWGLAALRAAPALSCLPIRHALCNPPACYEHEVNKTLGHHKSPANDMSGAEIRRAEWSSGAQSGGSHASHPAAACSSFSLLLGPNV